MIEQKQIKGKNAIKLTFTLPVSAVGEKRDVRALGDFNDWSWQTGVKMKAKGDNYVGTLEVPAAASSYQFRYLVDETQWENDHHAANYYDNAHGTTNGVVHIDAPLMPAVSGNGAAESKAPAKAKAPAKGAVKPAAAKATAKAPAKGKKAAAAKKPAAPKKDTATKGTAAKKADDLKTIEGVGPKIATLLKAAGIKSFNDLAKAPKSKLDSVIAEAGSRFTLAKTDTWQEQAKLAAAGKHDELAKLQKELKGGTRK